MLCLLQKAAQKAAQKAVRVAHLYNTGHTLCFYEVGSCGTKGIAAL